jgi:membrane-associated protease RseP (regulator of RpoE activity)
VAIVAGALALVFAALGLIAASFAGRYAAARLLGVRDIGIFGPRSAQRGPRVAAVRRAGAHAGGPLGAYVVPVVLCLVAFQLGGEQVTTTAIQVMPGTRADEAGLRDNDKITSIEGEPIADWEAMRGAIKARPALPTRVEIERDGQSQTIEVTPNEQGMIGVRPVMERRPVGLGKSLARAAIEPVRVVYTSLTAWVRILTGAERTELTGPVAISREVGMAQERRAADTFYLVGLLAAYVWPVFVLLEVLLAAATWRERRHKPPEAAAGP